MPLASIIQLALALLPIVTTGTEQFITWIASLRATAQQTGEWTPQMETAYRTALFAKMQDPAYLPDAAPPKVA